MKRNAPTLTAFSIGLILAAQTIASANADDGHSKSRKGLKIGISSNQTGLSGRSIQSKPGLQFQSFSQFQGQHQLTNKAITNKVLTNSGINLGQLRQGVTSGVVSNSQVGTTVAKKKFVNSSLASAIFNGVHYEQQHCQAPLTQPLWCQYHPDYCHWWWNYCGGLHTCTPVHYCDCNWNYVICPRYIDGVVIRQHCTWYLGVNGMLLPGSGLGVNAVDVGSPADRAGIRPGMVIVTANGIPLVDEGSAQRAIALSNGILRLEVRANSVDAPVTITVAMTLVSNVSL